MNCSTYLNELSFSLTYLDRIKIENKAAGLTEPSGLALSHEQDALWTISDDTKKFFKLSLDGQLQKDASFRIPDKGLEGIVLDPTGEFLLTVKEESNEIIKVNVDTREVADRKRLAGMAGFDEVASYFIGDGTNKGLEGITWNTATGTIFVMKEKAPGLLVEISSDLRTIQSHQLLNEKNGFRDSDVGADDLDFSDICYDPSRDRFWIISDKAERLFLYDWKENKVLQSAKLSYGKDHKYQKIKKPEGVVIDPEAKRLYVVSDEEARLYVFDIRQ
jgi:uncharacterized protein YjiK